MYQPRSVLDADVHGRADLDERQPALHADSLEGALASNTCDPQRRMGFGRAPSIGCRGDSTEASIPADQTSAEAAPATRPPTLYTRPLRRAAAW